MSSLCGFIWRFTLQGFDTNGKLSLQFETPLSPSSPLSLLTQSDSSASTRIITAAELVRLKKGEALVIGGGEYSSSGQTGLHGQLISEWLESWKPFDSPIHVLAYSSNTKDEADQTKVLAEKNGWKKIILVTSASHMRRAEALFKKSALKVVAVGSDFEGLSSLEADFRIYSIVPGLGGFQALSFYLHEQVGWLYYKLRGWV